MEDRRTRKTVKAIESSFLTLLEKKSLDKITVAEICRMADIGRGTFYLHYMDVYDLYNKVESEASAGLYKLFEEAFPSTDSSNSQKLAYELTAYISNKRELFLLFARDDNRSSLQRITRRLNEQVILENRLIHPDGDERYDAMEAVFVVSGMTGVLEEWLKGGMSVSCEEVAAALDKILCKINM